MLSGPFLWYLNRGTGLVLLVVLTIVVALGMWATQQSSQLVKVGAAASAGTAATAVQQRIRVPAFVIQQVHRQLAVLSLVMIVFHAAAAVVDTYVDIRWYHVVLPWGSSYEPLWVGAGALAVDLFLIVSITSAFRLSLPPLLWRAIHWTTYLAWVIAFFHSWQIGSDVRNPMGVVTLAMCAGLFIGSGAAYVIWRIRQWRGA